MIWSATAASARQPVGDGEADPAPTAEHPGVGAQGVSEETRGAGDIEALAVSGVRLSLALGEVVLLAAAAVRCGERGPAVGRDLEELQALASASPTRCPEMYSQENR